MGILNTIVYLLIALLVPIIPLGVIIGLIVRFTGDNNTPETKKKRNKLAWKIALYPIVIFVLVLVVWGLVNIVGGAFKPAV